MAGTGENEECVRWFVILKEERMIKTYEARVNAKRFEW